VQPVDPELKAEFEDQQKNSPLAGMHSAIQAATGGGSAPGAGMGGAGGFDLASWMAGSGKGGQQQGGTTSGAEVREGGARRR
jgi:ER membrane protein complex subunit 7